jgi:dolichol-phosphate mannosyltransferase
MLSGAGQAKPSAPVSPLPPIIRIPIRTPVDSLPPMSWTDIENPTPSSLSILLPALNEEQGIRAVLQRIPRKRLQRQGLATHVYLLDGHSTDRTRSVAKKLGAEIFVQTGEGKGSAFREFVPRIRSDVTVLLDSDGTYPPEVIPQLVGALGEGSPVVLGSRFRGSKMDEGAMSKVNYVGNRILSNFASFLFGMPISDVCSGMWAFASDRLKSLDLTATGFELEVDIFAECAIRRIPIAEIPIRYRRRIGVGKLRVEEGFRIAFALLKKRLRPKPGHGLDETSPQERPLGGPAEGAG